MTSAQTREVTWTGKVPAKDDFGDKITNEFIDGRLKNSTTWGYFTPRSWLHYGSGQLGSGFGQRYERREDGKFVKVEG